MGEALKDRECQPNTRRGPGDAPNADAAQANRAESRRSSADGRRARAPARGGRQLPLDLPAVDRPMRRETFITTAANAGDIATLETWWASAEPALVICGAASSGKSHLAGVLAQDEGADVAAVAQDGGIDQVAGDGLFIIDGLERLSRPTLLLEAIERARTGRGRLALVGRGRPQDWANGLIDLETRLSAIPRIEVSPPDEALLRQIMQKLFADRQVRVDAKVIEYAAPRIRRSLAAAIEFCRAADELALDAGSAVTLAIARRAVEAAELDVGEGECR